MPTKEQLEIAYAAVASQADLTEVYEVSLSTIRRWFIRLGVQARPADGTAVDPERRRGAEGAHVTVRQARKMRQLKRDHPEMSLREIVKKSGASCSREYARLILAGKRINVPEAFPD